MNIMDLVREETNVIENLTQENIVELIEHGEANYTKEKGTR